jgi:hypothetical protein
MPQRDGALCAAQALHLRLRLNTPPGETATKGRALL